VLTHYQQTAEQNCFVINDSFFVLAQNHYSSVIAEKNNIDADKNALDTDILLGN